MRTRNDEREALHGPWDESQAALAELRKAFPAYRFWRSMLQTCTQGDWHAQHITTGVVYDAASAADLRQMLEEAS
ncbi:hypothetical protein [Streptomonospora litoralis]|uniref:Uncharacterized protein n=1 Tax=Streptomonospora litoralis TaxID=2498135 RepID=A0A4V0ZJG5_9ACTN|nr:hypothetical protein [Streptomonospora litoralis]QBI53402.1 hypothetical protein EKD16_08040 [Streptomonospora litoralis]